MRIVHYSKIDYVKVGESAFLWPTDHPDTLRASNKHVVQTSPVQCVDESTGTIVTRDTVYVPDLEQFEWANQELMLTPDWGSAHNESKENKMAVSAKTKEMIAEKVSELKLEIAGFKRCERCGVPINRDHGELVKWCIVKGCDQYQSKE